MKTSICISVDASDESLLAVDSELALALRCHADALVELRFDGVGHDATQRLRAFVEQCSPSRLVVTCRAQRDLPAHLASRGATAIEQVRVYDAAVRCGCAWVDVDVRSWRAHVALRETVRQRSPATKLLVSQHAFGQPLSIAAAQQFLSLQKECGADAMKIAVTATPYAAMVALWRFAFVQTRTPLLFVAMGEAGTWTRFVAHRAALAPPFVYVRLRHAAPTASGQPTWQEYVTLRRERGRGEGGSVFGVMGRPIGHSLSPALHTKVLDALDIDGMYIPISVGTKEETKRFVDEVAPVLGLVGLSITLPNKSHVLCSRPTKTASVRHSGACNTLVIGDAARRQRKLADNTDVTALIDRLRALSPDGLAHKRIGILGAGGVARAAVTAVRALGGKPVVVARRKRRASALSRDVLCWPVDEKHGPAWSRLAGLVQCTPVGMAPDVARMPVSETVLAALPRTAWVLDTVYQPETTAFVARAHALGLRAEGGLPMFLRQAALQCARFYLVKPDDPRVIQSMEALMLARQMAASRT